MIGICTLSNIPIRLEPESKSEIVSQLLFGETFNVIEQKNGWTQIITHDDEYPGWISSMQFEILISAIKHKYTTNIFPFVKAISKTGNILIPAGSTIPNIHGNSFTINHIVYQLPEIDIKQNVNQPVTIALPYENVPYLWGGRTPFGIDCSGFTQTVYKQCGVQLKRDAYQQAEQGETVSFLEEARSGDLVFFDNEEGKITHVGMMIDSGRVIHASGRVRIDTIDNFGIINKEQNQYSHKLRIIKRITP